MELRRPGRRGVALAAMALALCVTTGAAGAGCLALAGRDARAAALALRTASVRTALDATFQRYADTVHDLVAAAPAAVPGIAGERLPGAHQVLMTGPDGTVLAQHSADGSAPAPITRLTPEPELARALQLARLSGRLVTTPAHVLPADASLPPAHRQPAFELAAPMRTGGWVVVSVRAGDLLDTSLRAAGVTGVGVTLSETGPDGVARPVASWAGGGGPDDRFDVALAGHAWTITVRPTTSPAGAGRSAAAPLLLVAGVLTGLITALIVLLLAGDRRRTAAAVAGLRAERVRADRAEAVLREREAELAGFTETAGERLHAPLHTIAGFTDLLLEDADPAARGFLERIGARTGSMIALVDELLAYTAATDTALRPEPVDTERLVLDVAAERTAGHAGPRPSIDVGELPLVTGDAVLLRQVVERLIDNAVRYVRPGAAARVTVSAREQSPGWWRVEVADRGIGVPAEHRERIFAPFHRAPSAEGFPGTGLGLALCRRIVALHGGEIGAEANPGGGSVFWFTVSASGVTLSADDLAELAAA